MRVVAAALLSLSACSGLIDMPAGPAPVVVDPKGPLTEALDCTGPQSIRVPTQRLNAWQFERVVREALGDELRLAPTYPVTQVSAGPYATYPETNPPADFAIKGIAESAEAVADAITDTLPACDAGSEASCASWSTMR